MAQQRFSVGDSRTQRQGAVVGVVIVAAVLRFYRLGADSLWLDEVFTVVVWPQKNLNGLFFGAEPHPPLYFVLSNGWVSIFGASTMSARMLPALFGIALVGAVIHAGRVYCDHWTGVTAGLLVAISPTFVHFSQTARMYSLWGLLTVVSMTCFTVLLYRDHTPLLLYLISTIGMVYTHAFGAFMLVLQNGYVLGVTLGSVQPNRLTWRAWIRLQLIVGLLSIPVGIKYVEVFLGTLSGSSESTIDWLTAPTLSEFIRTLVSFGGRPIYYPRVAVGSIAYTTSLVVLTLAVAMGVYGIYQGRDVVDTDIDGDQAGKWWDRPSLVLLVWLLGITVVPFFVSRIVPVFTPRNVHIAAVPLFLLASLGISSLRNSPFETVVSPLRITVIVVAVGGLLVSTAVYYDTSGAEDWRGAASFVDENDVGNETVVSVPPWASRPFTFYADSGGDQVVGWQSGQDVSSLPVTDRIWVVSRYPEQGEELRQSLNETMRHQYDRQFRNVRVTLYVTAGENETEALSTAGDTSRDR